MFNNLQRKILILEKRTSFHFITGYSDSILNLGNRIILKYDPYCNYVA